MVITNLPDFGHAPGSSGVWVFLANPTFEIFLAGFPDLADYSKTASGACGLFTTKSNVLARRHLSDVAVCHRSTLSLSRLKWAVCCYC